MFTDPVLPAPQATGQQAVRPEAATPVDPLAAQAARVTHREPGAERELYSQLEAFIPDLLSTIRKNRAPHLAGKIDSEGVINAAIHSLLTGLPKGEFPDVATTDNVRKLLSTIVANKLRSEVRAHSSGRRDAGREVRTEGGRPHLAADTARTPTDVPLALLAHFADSGLPGRKSAKVGTPATEGGPAASAAAELIVWLETWADELRSVHPLAMEIIELSFRGRTNKDIATELKLGIRRLQGVKQSLRELLERKLVHGVHSHVADPALAATA
jgi:hypothetical protein